MLCIRRRVRNLRGLTRGHFEFCSSTVCRGLYDAEKMLNDEIAHASQVLQAGIAIPETIKTVHTAERALRKLEAEAATRKAAIAQRDGLVAELDYLVALKGQAAGETEGALVRTARAAVEGALEKDAKVQQASIEAAIKALTTGVPAEDVVAPLFDKAVAQAKVRDRAGLALWRSNINDLLHALPSLVCTNALFLTSFSSSTTTSSPPDSCLPTAGRRGIQARRHHVALLQPRPGGGVQQEVRLPTGSQAEPHQLRQGLSDRC